MSNHFEICPLCLNPLLKFAKSCNNCPWKGEEVLKTWQMGMAGAFFEADMHKKTFDKLETLRAAAQALVDEAPNWFTRTPLVLQHKIAALEAALKRVT